MTVASGLIFAFLGLLAVVMIYVCIKSGSFWKGVGFCSISGLGSLGAVSVIGSMTTFILDFNLFTALVSAILGIPGVLAMLIIKLLFKG